jgi:23S rRNA pseudouridine1911/1915/1917 synthase
VHRLDKDTSGLLVVARTPLAHKSLTEQLKARTLKREYRALVLGELVGDGRVEAPIGRHPTRRTSMAVVAGGRPAVTEYRVLWGYPGLTWLAVHLQTGRTHQIRVHMSHIRHPLLGDPLYGARPRLPAGLSLVALAALRAFPRQALHAIRLGLVHPASGEAMSWQAPLAADLGALLQVLDAEQGPDHGVR